MPQNDFLPFATGVDANVLDQADYAALAAVINGFQPGIAQSAQLNKVWRQSSFWASVIAQFVANQTGDAVLDDGDAAGKLALLTSAIQIGANIKPARIVTVSTALVFAPADYAIGLLRTASPAATAASLPSTAQNGQEFVLDDLKGNFFGFPVTVSVPAGDNILGEPSFVCAVDGGSWIFRKYVNGGSSVWSVRS